MEQNPQMPTGTQRITEDWAKKFLQQEEWDMRKGKFFKGYRPQFYFKTKFEGRINHEP